MVSDVFDPDDAGSSSFILFKETRTLTARDRILCIVVADTSTTGVPSCPSPRGISVMHVDTPGIQQILVRPAHSAK